MPSAGFCEKSNGKWGLLSGGPAERDSQLLPQLLVEQKMNRKASSSWRHFPSAFWEMSHGIWVACCRSVPTVAKVKLEPRVLPYVSNRRHLRWPDSVWIFSYTKCFCSLDVCKTRLTCHLCVEVNFEDPEQSSWVSFIRVLICIL